MSACLMIAWAEFAVICILLAIIARQAASSAERKRHDHWRAAREKRRA